MIALRPLGDQAALVSFATEGEAVRFAERVRRCGAAWLVDVVGAYVTVAVFFDLLQTDFAAVSAALRELEIHPDPTPTEPPRRHRIPCCYALGPDLDRVAKHTGLSPDAVIDLHAGTEYTVYAIGFCPGFPYLGYLPDRLCGVPRLPTPRVRVEPGTVGMTGRQTGIYTEPRPGGWNLIGRTPLQLVDVAAGYFPLNVGDRVRFEPIGRTEFDRLAGRRL